MAPKWEQEQNKTKTNPQDQKSTTLYLLLESNLNPSTVIVNQSTQSSMQYFTVPVIMLWHQK